MYDKDPLSKPELLNHMVKRISEQTDLTKIFRIKRQGKDVTKIFRIKRQGKDVNDFFWQFGKIHGLENIAFCDPVELSQVNGNPVKLQKLINKVTPEDIPGLSSYDMV